MNTLRVVTLNLWNNDYLRFERAHLVSQELANLQPHLIALQEVSVLHDMSTWIVNRLNEWSFGDKYFAFSWNKIGPQGAFEGIAILTRLPILEPNLALDLNGGGRIAQQIIVSFEHHSIAFCNLHLHHSRNLNKLRISQARIVSDWLLMNDKHINLLVGDFNSKPDSPVMQFLFKDWQSAFKIFNNKEPEYTFPTPLIKETNDWISHRVIDYILYSIKSKVSIVNAQLCFGKFVDGSYPSDHYGILVDFNLTNSN